MCCYGVVLYNNIDYKNNKNEYVNVCLVDSLFDLVISSMQSANERKYSFISCSVGSTDCVWAVLIM